MSATFSSFIFVLVVRAHGDWLVGVLFPLWWILASSWAEQRAGAALAFGSRRVAHRSPVRQLWQAMQEVGTTPWLDFIDALSNSIVVTVLVVIGTILSSSLGAQLFK